MRIKASLIAMDWRVAIRAGLTQLVSVAVLSLALGLALPRSFFEDWGWLAGPGAWIACALLTARVTGLAVAPVLVGAALAGVPSVVAVIAGLHWLGALIAVVVLALWCGRLAVDRGLDAEII